MARSGILITAGLVLLSAMWPVSDSVFAAGPLFVRCIVDVVEKRSETEIKVRAFGTIVSEAAYDPAEDEDGDGDVDGINIL